MPAIAAAPAPAGPVPALADPRGPPMTERKPRDHRQFRHRPPRCRRQPPIRVGMIGAGFMASGVVLQTGGAYPRFDQHRRHRQPHAAKAVDAYAAAGFEDPVMRRQRAGARAGHRGGPPGGHRGSDAGGDQPACGRGARGDRRGRGRHRPGARRGRARQAHALDEPRARRHARAALQAQGRQGRRGLHRRRRRPARGHRQPLPLREGARGAPGAARQHQGAAGPLPQPDHAGRLRQALGAEAAHGDLLRRRHQGVASR